MSKDKKNVRGKVKHFRVFWSKNLGELKRKREILRNTAEGTGKTEDVQAWRRQSAVLRQAILQAKRTTFNSFISNIICQNDSQHTFKFLDNLLINKKKSRKEPIGLNNKLHATPSRRSIPTNKRKTHLSEALQETSRLNNAVNWKLTQTAEIHGRKKLHQLLKEKTIVFQWIPGLCGIIGNDRADTLVKKRTTILQVIDRLISFYKMKTLIWREFKTSRSNAPKAQTKKKQWTAEVSNIYDWPRLEAVAEFRLCTGHDCLAKHLHRIGVYTQPTYLLCDLQEEMEKTHLIRCPVLQTVTETQR
nr:hypothetical transcript [Hymenolepis microstoma]